MPTVPVAQRAQAQQESDNDWKHYWYDKRLKQMMYLRLILVNGFNNYPFELVHIFQLELF